MGTPRSRAAAAAALVVGGLVAAVVFVPFTIAHGPTSYNLERQVIGWDMHNWGFVMGTIPPLLVGAGLRVLRATVAGERKAAHRALSVMCVAMFLFAAMNVAFRAIGPPFDLFLLAPASVVAARTTPRRGSVKTLLVLLAAAYCVGMAMVMIPLETSDSYDGFRIFGIVIYAGIGLLWAALGAVLHGQGENISAA